jgi:hypothetical protein
MFIAIPSFVLLYSMDEVVVDPAVTIKAIGHQWYWTYEYSDYNSSDELNHAFLPLVAEGVSLKDYGDGVGWTHWAGGEEHGEGSSRGLDLNKSADPAIVCPDDFRISLRELRRVVPNLDPTVREGIFPNAKYPLYSNVEIREGISEFLKERDPTTLGKDLCTFLGMGKDKKESPLFKDFINYRLEKLSRR